jgi:uncharacterized glyoxalase superfamily protein PhnB
MAKKKAAKAPKRVMRKPVKKAVKKSVRKVARRAVAKAAPKKAVKKAPAARGFALQSVAPGFTANDAAASIAWYCDVLGFTRGERWEYEGEFRGGEVKSGNVTINIGQDDWKLGRFRVKGAGMRIYITTGPGIDAYAKEIQGRGGTLAQEPKDEWGMRTFSIDDPDGFKLTFMSAL